MKDEPLSPATPLLSSVLDSLGREIISGKLKEGETFTLQTTGERFDISRTVAREAMRALEQLGLVVSSRRVGITVQPKSKWAVFDDKVIAWRLETDSERASQLHSLTELRIGVEPVASYNAALHATDEQRAELKDLAAVMRQLGESIHGDSYEFLEADTRYHALILEASGNEMFAALAPTLNTALVGRTKSGLQPGKPNPQALDAHDKLAEAIASGNAEEAEQASRAILSEVREALHDAR